MAKHGISLDARDQLLFEEGAKEHHANLLAHKKRAEASGVVEPTLAAKRNQDIASAAARIKSYQERNAPTRAKLSPEEHATILKAASDASAVDETGDAKKLLSKALKNAPKQEQMYEDLDSAISKGESKIARKLADKLDNASTLRTALVEVDPLDNGIGADHYALGGFHESHSQSKGDLESARKRVDRKARAVRVHEREVARTGKKVDADGDGRTGAAEVSDDKPAAL